MSLLSARHWESYPENAVKTLILSIFCVLFSLIILIVLKKTGIVYTDKRKRRRNHFRDLKRLLFVNYMKELEDDSLMYHALEMNGVDNWTWWDEDVEDYNKMKEEEE